MKLLIEKGLGSENPALKKGLRPAAKVGSSRDVVARPNAFQWVDERVKFS